MNKRAILVHQWYGNPNGDWLPWAKQELEKLGYGVTVLAMPNPDAPQINSWVETLAQAVGQPDENLTLVGHSIGCQTILRYLETLSEGQKVGKVILVAPWFSLTEEATPSDEEKEIAKPWLETPLSWEKVRSKAVSFVAIFSNNDPYVPLEENRKIFEQKLGAKIVVENNKGHFSEDDKVFELPEILKYTG